MEFSSVSTACGYATNQIPLHNSKIHKKKESTTRVMHKVFSWNTWRKVIFQKLVLLYL